MVVAGLLKEGAVRDTLLTADAILFLAPVYIREEVSRHAGMISDRSKVPLETVLAVLEDLLSAIELIPSAAYASSILDARRLARTAAAQGDEDYIALSLAFDAPAWTLDRDIARVPGLRVLSTRDVGRL